MRKSTKLLTVAAALGFVVIGAGSAFTASNTVPASFAGYGEGLVSGTTVTAVHYTLDVDNSKIDAVTFADTDNLDGAIISMTLKKADDSLIGASPYTCTQDAGHTLITCPTADNPLLVDIGKTDLSVS